jgi:hypothetical protein
MLWPFLADLRKAPDRVKPAHVLAWVHGICKSGRTPSTSSTGAGVACLSSFYYTGVERPGPSALASLGATGGGPAPSGQPQGRERTDE